MHIKIIDFSQNILLHSLMPITILFVIFGIITGLKICWFSNISRNFMKWDNHTKSFSASTNAKLVWKIWRRQSQCFWRYNIVNSVHFFGTPGITHIWYIRTCSTVNVSFSSYFMVLFQIVPPMTPILKFITFVICFGHDISLASLCYWGLIKLV